MTTDRYSKRKKVPGLFTITAMICAALFLTFLLYIAWVRMPVRINPREITSCPCTVTDNAISLQPQGFRNPHKKKQWKVTARYDEEKSTLYVSCWLKADDTFSSFDYESKKLNRKDYGKIDKMVLLGGWLNQEELVIWENGSPTLP